MRTIPVAAVSGITIAELMASMTLAQAAPPLSEGQFQVIKTSDLAQDIKALAAEAGPANSKRLFNDKNFILDLWMEKKNTGKEYEWHEHRDHVIEILEGSTEYELGGTPQNAHSTGPGEWLAPTMEGVTKRYRSKRVIC